jgi:hypothetical protein
VASWTAVAAAIALYLSFQVPRLSAYSYGWDEGFYLQVGWLVSMGFRPHSDFFFSQVPGFAWLLGGLYAALGHSVEGFRATLVLSGVATLAIVGWMSMDNVGRIAGTASTWLLALNPKFQDLTRTIEADSLALPLMLLAVALVAAYRTQRIPRLTGALLSGLVLGLGTQLKLSAAVILPLLVLSILYRGRVRDAVACVAAWALVLGAILALSSPREAVAQFLVFQSRGAVTYGLDVAGNLVQLTSFLWVDRGLVLLGLAGVLLSQHRGFAYWASLGWIASLGAFLLIKSPLYDHNLVVLVPGLALLGGLALQGLTAKSIRLGSGRLRRSSVVVAAVATVYLVLAPRLLAMDLAQRPDDGAASRAVSFLSVTVPQGAWVVSDDPMIAFRARLRLVPQLADTSNFRLATGYLSARQLVEITHELSPAAVIAWERFQRNVPEYVQWLKTNYREVWSDGGHSVFLRR